MSEGDWLPLPMLVRRVNPRRSLLGPHAPGGSDTLRRLGPRSQVLDPLTGPLPPHHTTASIRHPDRQADELLGNRCHLAAARTGRLTADTDEHTSHHPGPYRSKSGRAISRSGAHRTLKPSETPTERTIPSSSMDLSIRHRPYRSLVETEGSTARTSESRHTQRISEESP